MAFSCTVFALDASVKRRLKLAGMSVPLAAPSGRNPTPKDLKEAMSNLIDYQVQFQEGPGAVWYAHVWHAQRPALHPWAYLWIDHYRGQESPQPFRFVRGSPELMVRIVEELANRLGNLVLAPDDGTPPVVIPAHPDCALFVESWRRNQQSAVERVVPPSLQVGGELETRLAKIEWFSHCGEPCEFRLSFSITPVKSWSQALRSCCTASWSNVDNAAMQALLTFSGDYEEDWPRFVQDRRQVVLNPLLEQHIRPFQERNGFPIEFVHSVQANIFGALMEDIFTASNSRRFFHELMVVYELGHFPCGWIGKWPEGQLRVY